MSKTLSKNMPKLVFIGACVLLGVYILSDTGRPTIMNEGRLGGGDTDVPDTGSMVRNENVGEPNYLNTQQMGKLDGQDVHGMNEQSTQAMQVMENNACYPKEQLSARELLPKDKASEWANVNPGGVGSLCDKNFLQAGAMIGIDTVGQVNRNANLQLRSDPVIKQTIVSPWLQSTIQPDILRRPMDVGTATTLDFV